MDNPQVADALSTIAAFLATRPDSEEAVRARWRAGERGSGELPAEVGTAADLL